MSKLSNGLVYTNDKCVACNKCISVCPVPGANHAVIDANGNASIEVNGDACIACGACFDVKFVDEVAQTVIMRGYVFHVRTCY